jgi:hypothetical protein
MATINGTITGCTLLASNHGQGGELRKAFLCSASFAAYTGSSDTYTVTGINTAIAAHERNGKTLTLLDALPFSGGVDTNGQLVYIAAAVTPSNQTTTGDIAGNLTAADGTTELTSSTAAQGVQFIATVKEA